MLNFSLKVLLTLMGLARREHWVVFEDAMLTLCDFYRVLKSDAIHVHLLLVHTCT